MSSLQFQDLLIEDLLPQDKSLHRSCRERIDAWTSENVRPLMVLYAQFASAPEGRRRTEQQSVSHASFATLVEAAGLTKKEQVVTDTVFARAVGRRRSTARPRPARRSARRGKRSPPSSRS